MSPLKVVRLEAENLKRISAVEIVPDPDGNLVVISGRNGQGKTSILDSIFLALAGKAAAKDTPQPIRDGETTAHAIVDLGDFTVTRHWYAERPSKLTVEAKDGSVYRSPQTFLDAKLGALSFDPLAFTRKPEREQRDDLLALVDLPFNPDDLAAERQVAFDTRTEVGRRLRAMQGQLAALPDPGDDVPDEPVATDEITTAMGELLDRRRSNDAVVDRYRQLKEMVSEQTDAVEALEAELTAARSALTATTGKRDEALAAVDALEDLPDMGTYQEALEAALATNELVRYKQERAKVAAEVSEIMDRHDGLNARLEELDRTKATALLAAAMPVDGLGIDDAGVTYHGIPFRQCSAAEQLRVSLAMAMAANPTIGVIRITDGSLLDSASMAIVAEMAERADCQVWIERVSDEGGIGFVIEDGSVVA